MRRFATCSARCPRRGFEPAEPQRLCTDFAPIRAPAAATAGTPRTVAPVPATSPPAARSLAAAILPLVVAAVASLAVPSSALAARWLRPVPGEVARPFDYARATPFAAGAHRGVDLAAAPGSRVRAACAGVVTHAGPVPGGERAVSVRCDGSWRATFLPLARVAVAAGAAVRAGAALGTLAGGHGGLHLGVRREGDPFGYVDPLALLAPPTAPLRPPCGCRVRAPGRRRSRRRLRSRHRRARSPRRPRRQPGRAGLRRGRSGWAPRSWPAAPPGSGTLAVRRRRRRRGMRSAQALA